MYSCQNVLQRWKYLFNIEFSSSSNMDIIKTLNIQYIQCIGQRKPWEISQKFVPCHSLQFYSNYDKTPAADQECVSLTYHLTNWMTHICKLNCFLNFVSSSFRINACYKKLILIIFFAQKDSSVLEEEIEHIQIKC